MGITLLKSKITKSLVIIMLLIVLILSLTVSTVSASILGDVNDDGRIDVQDVTLVMRHALGIALLSSSQQESADVNGDGVVNVQDTALIVQKTLEIIDVFPDPKEIDTALEMTVHYIDVGQGDSILIETSEKNILIDGGNRGDTVLTYLQNLNITELDIVIGTHPHADHIGGLINVIGSIEVKEVIDPGVVHTTKTFEDYLNLIDEKDILFTFGRAGMTRVLSEGISLQLLHPNDPKSDSLNNASIVARIVFNQVSFLFIGDAEIEAENEMLNSSYTLNSTFLKVGHHGSRTSTSQAFLNAVKPEVAVIMCGLNNTYGHPHQETLDRLTQANVDIYRTDLQGTIIISTDGQTYEINTKPFTEAPPKEDPDPAPTCKVNINTASFEELQLIIHIGTTRAQEIISLRPFYSLDGLLKVTGIGEVRLQDIKDQGIAYVE